MRSFIGSEIALAITWVACGAEPSHEEHEHEEHAHDEHEEAGASDDLLHIEPSMIRDLRITTARVESRTGGETIVALGEVRPDETRYAEVRTLMAARVVEVHVSPGDRVERGQPLVSLESLDAGEARGALTRARARAELAQQTLERRRALVADQAVSERDLQEAEAELRSAQAEVRTAQGMVGSMGRGSGTRVTLTAPVAGTVLERSAILGSVVEHDHILFRVGDLSTVWLVVHAFERDAVRIQPGASASIAFAALPGETFTGRVALVGSRVDTASRTIDVRIDVVNDGRLRPGMSGTARIGIGDPNDRLLSVPMLAVQRCDEHWCVFVPRGEAEFEIRAVGRGRDLGDEIEIVNGLRAGEEVVVEGAFMLKAQADRARGGGDEHHHH